MRLTAVLHKIQLYRLIKQHWKVQRKRVPIETNAGKAVTEKGLELIDANDVIKEERKKESLNIIGFCDLPLPKNERHPLYHKEPCYIFSDNNVLLEGLDQALVLTNSVLLDGLPVQIEDQTDDEIPSQDNLVQRCVKSTFLYDAEQKKLPIRKDPERPAWNFPRDYGVTDKRRNRLLCNRLLQLCSMGNRKMNPNRSVINDALFSVPLLIDNIKVQLELRSDVLITARSPLSSIVDPASSSQYSLPDISPLHPLVSFQENNFYQMQDIFPVKSTAKHFHAHTAIIHFNETEVKNLYETEVTNSQVISRSLVKSYAIAVAQARHNYGTTVKKLPEPITIQSIHTDGQMFAFNILQLNTLSHEGNVHNIFWSMPIIQLFSHCEYIKGKPVLQDYNPEVFRRILAFYNNDSIKQS